MDFSVNLPGDDQLRKAYRTRVPGLAVRVKDTGKVYEVKDLSAGGFAVLDTGKAFKEGKDYDLELLLKKKLFLSGIRGRVMRVLDNGIVGWSFGELDRRQEIKLDKLVLEVQKRLIQLKKARKAQEDDE